MPYRILLVDDHEMVREGFRRVLDAPGLTVCAEASNGKEGIEKALGLNPDLILMDLSMPVMGGLEATRQIRRALPNSKIIIVSFHESQQIIDQAKEAGADGYVVKSRRADELIDLINSVLGKEGLAESAALASDGIASKT